jgi:ribosome-associated protein
MENELIATVKDYLEEMKVLDIRVLDLKEHTLFDAFVVGTCTSSRHLKASAEFVRFESKKGGFRCLGIETSENWVAMDMGNIGVHLFNEELRKLYDLEGLWEEGKLDVGLVLPFIERKSRE